MIGERDDQHRVLPWVALFVILVILTFGIFLLILFLTNRGGEVSSSSEPTTSEASSIPLSTSEEASSIYDDYIDVTISNINKYIKKVGSDTLSISWSVKDIHSINMYVDSSTSILVYGFTVNEEDDKYIRMEIDIEKELSSMEEVVKLIHDDSVSIDMFISYEQYQIVSDDLVSKKSYKELYPGDYTYSLAYKSDAEEYYYSGIGKNKEDYISIDYLSYDHSTYEINTGGSHMNSASNGRYYQLLEKVK